MKLSFSLRQLLSALAVASVCFMFWRYTCLPVPFNEKANNSLTYHVIISEESLLKAGASDQIRNALRNANEDSFQRPEIITAWFDSENNDLLIWFLAREFRARSVRVHFEDGSTEDFSVPATCMQRHLARSRHSIDFDIHIYANFFGSHHPSEVEILGADDALLSDKVKVGED